MTAQRRSERLIDVPASVAAVSEEAILRTGAKRLSELSDNIPNLIISSTTSLGSQVNIRGVGASSRNIGFDTRVGVYLDGVYLGQSPALNQELVDLERVEVLRGPQGALFGKNTVAGAINLISKKPSNEREAFVGARIGNFDERTFTTRLNLPLGETAAAKLSLNRAERDGFTTNLLDGRTLGDRDAFSWRGQLRFTPNEQLEVLASFDGLRTRERGDYGDPISDTFGVTVDRTAPGRRQVAIDHLSVDRRDILGASVEAAYTLESGTVLKSISAWRDTEFFSTVDVDYSPVNLFWVDFSDAYEQWSQELQWLSPKGERLEYLLGLYLYRQDGQTHREGFAGTAGPALGLASGARLPSAGEVTTKNVAAFGNTTYALTDRLKLGVGFRWSWEKKSVDYQIDGRAMAPLGIATGTFVDDHIDKDFSPTFTLNYAWTPRVTGYLRYAQGYKSGGYNLDFVSPTIFPNALEFEKETARSYEAGLKGDAFDRKLTFAFALFQTDFEDFQVDQFRDLGGGKVAIVIGNAAKARSKGAELEGSWRPTANLSFTGGLGVLDTTFVSFPGGGAQGRDVSGNRLPGASKVQGNLAADYLIPVGDWQVALHADYSHRGAYYSSVDNVEARPLRGGGSVVWGKVKSQDLVNARVALSDPDRGWELALWARNLFDRDYIAGYGSDFFGTSKQYYNPPRTWGVELGWSF